MWVRKRPARARMTRSAGTPTSSKASWAHGTTRFRRRPPRTSTWGPVSEFPFSRAWGSHWGFCWKAARSAHRPPHRSRIACHRRAHVAPPFPAERAPPAGPPTPTRERHASATGGTPPRVSAIGRLTSGVASNASPGKNLSPPHVHYHAGATMRAAPRCPLARSRPAGRLRRRGCGDRSETSRPRLGGLRGGPAAHQLRAKRIEYRASRPPRLLHPLRGRPAAR
jgi:hypothetical protein